MADCEFLEKCPFFNNEMSVMPATSEVIKLRYCQGAYADCARYQVRKALGPGSVPADMFPTHHERARELARAGCPAQKGAA